MALTININFDSSVDNAPAGFRDVVAQVVQYFDSQFTLVARTAGDRVADDDDSIRDGGTPHRRIADSVDAFVDRFWYF